MPVTYKNLPGPKGLPLIGNLHQFKLSGLHRYLEQCASTYGDVFKVKLGPAKFTVVGKPEIIQQILKARPHGFRRMSKMDKILRTEGVHGVFNAEGDDWKVHRRIVNKGLNLKHQQKYFPSILKSVDRLYNSMSRASESDSGYQVQDDLTRFTVDVTTSLAFGFEMNTLEQKGGVIQEHMEKLFPMIFKRTNAPFPWHKIYRTKADRAYNEAFVEIEKYVQQYIAAGRQRLKDRPELREHPEDILEALIIASDEEEAISDREIKGNLLTLLLAGEDTTAHSLAWAIFLLAQNPEWQSRLQQEADEVLGDRKFLKEYADHDSLPFTGAVISETLRMKSVAPLLLLEPLEDTVIDGFHFEKGAKIILLIRHGGLSSSYFSDADHFNPDRWLESSTRKCPVHNLDAFLPFGFGPRLCPGKNLAILEMKLVLSMMARHFIIEMVTPPNAIQENMAFTMMPDKFEIRLKKR